MPTILPTGSATSTPQKAGDSSDSGTAGIGTSDKKYLLAYFSPTGTLHTQESPDGQNWSNDLTHGTFNVDQHSRPSVAFDYHTSRWYVAFRQSNN